MSTTLSPSKRYMAAFAANAKAIAAAAGRPGQLPQLCFPSDFDENGDFHRKLYLPDQHVPIEDLSFPLFDVDSRNPDYTVDYNLKLYPEDEKLMQTSPDWKVRWELDGKLWLCELRGFRPSINPLAPFELPDDIIICSELEITTDSVRECWVKAVVQFPLIPPHQLLPVVSTRMVVNIGCPFPGCHHIIYETGDVEDHLANAHFSDDPARTWLNLNPISKVPKDVECSCIYDRATGDELLNSPDDMNRREFLDHVVQEHFYAEAVHCRFCGIPVTGVDKYPKHMTHQCPVLKPWYNATEIPVDVNADGEDVVMNEVESPSKRRRWELGPPCRSARLAVATAKADDIEPDSDNDEPMGGSISDMDDSTDEHIECSPAQVPVADSLDMLDAMRELTALSDDEESVPAVEATPTRRSLRIKSKPRKTWSKRDFGK
ncbi:hypothetical protein Moror_4067 [Moniliophthora roreri MCA 2997]|uniref:C2H2-type domain-containing protein n=1 Tax=Moniliophthora roreri (strain MCA 2997) TaxID=1381753 RepID=V2XE70_MONRO|nr:hypothetical protein Moror_4067 [Moniliophthora roreri MCA 2997]